MPRTMNDPHVATLTFRIEHDSSGAYRADAPPIQHEEDSFRASTDGGSSVARVVWNALTNPDLCTAQDPANTVAIETRVLERHIVRAEALEAVRG